MKLKRKYLVAVALLAVLAVVFGLAGSVAPSTEVVSPQQSSSSSDSVAHFMNPPTYDSGWVNITDKCGQDITLVHNLNTVDITVDLTGRIANLTEEDWHLFWSMGDVNRDGYIDDADGDLISAAWGSTPGDSNWNPDADLNQDLLVWVEDLNIYGLHYGLDIWTYFSAGTHQRYIGLTAYTSGWSRTYGFTDEWNEGFSVIHTSDGGYALAGVRAPYPVGDSDVWLVKTDSHGNMMWERTYDGDLIETSYDGAYSVIQTSDGGYALAGYKQLMGETNDFWLVKTDAHGWMEWDQTYGGAGTDIAHSLVQTSDGGYAIAGHSNSFGPNPDMWLVKTDQSGSPQWDRRTELVGSDYGEAVIQTDDGGYAVVGYADTWTAPYLEAFLFKVSSGGTPQWIRRYGGADDDSAYSVAQTSDGGYALAGRTESYGAGESDFWLVKADSSGIMQWNRTYGGVEFETASSVVETSEGGYALGGTASREGPFFYFIDDFWLVKTDPDGNMQWNRTFDMDDEEIAHSLVQTVDGGYALVGNTGPWDWPFSDFWLVKTSVESGLAWTDSTADTITLYRGATDAYWNYVRVRIWTIEEPTWMFGDINQDGIVDIKDLTIVGQNYGKTFSILSLTGIGIIAGIHIYKTRKQPR